MKWFKHYSDASRGDLLSKINREFGLQGEARWWRLIELMAERYPVENDTFTFTSELLRRSMSFRSLIDLESFLDRLQIHSGLIVNRLENDYELIYSKLSEIKDNHTKNLQATGKKVSLDKNKIRIDKNKNNIKENPDVETVFEYFNERCEWLHLNKNGLDSKFNPIRKTPKMLALIAARLKDFSVDDCKFVIRNKSNDLWLVENGYFKIQTLFGPKNFEKYLSEAEIDDCLFTAIDIGRKIYDIERGFEHDNA